MNHTKKVGRIVLGEGFLVHVGTQDNVATIIAKKGVRMIPMSNGLWLINGIKELKFPEKLVNAIKLDGKKIRLIAEVL